MFFPKHLLFPEEHNLHQMDLQKHGLHSDKYRFHFQCLIHLKRHQIFLLTPLELMCLSLQRFLKQAILWLLIFLILFLDFHNRLQLLQVSHSKPTASTYRRQSTSPLMQFYYRQHYFDFLKIELQTSYFELLTVDYF